jgi:hypothetical protein
MLLSKFDGKKVVGETRSSLVPASESQEDLTKLSESLRSLVRAAARW